MTLADIFVSMASLFAPALLAILVLCAAMLAIVKFSAGTTGIAQKPFLVSFGFLGGISGLIAGVSKQSIVEALLTGILGIISALLMYLLSKESLKEWRPIIPFALILLLVSALAGLCIGGSYRTKRIQADNIYARRLMLYEKVDLPVCKEERLMVLSGKPLPENYKSVSCPPPQ